MSNQQNNQVGDANEDRRSRVENPQQMVKKMVSVMTSDNCLYISRELAAELAYNPIYKHAMICAEDHHAWRLEITPKPGTTGFKLYWHKLNYDKYMLDKNIDLWEPVNKVDEEAINEKGKGKGKEEAPTETGKGKGKEDEPTGKGKDKGEGKDKGKDKGGNEPSTPSELFGEEEEEDEEEATKKQKKKKRKSSFIKGQGKRRKEASQSPE